MIRAADFYRDYQYALEHDFEKDGQPPSWAAGGPQHWGSEKARVHFDREVTKIALSKDDSKLVVCLTKEVRIYDAGSLDLLRTIHCPHPPSAYLSATGDVLGIEMDIREAMRMNHVITLVALGDDTPNALIPADVIQAAARSAASAALDVLSQHPTNWSTEDIESTDLVQKISDVLGTASAVREENRGRFWDGSFTSWGYPFNEDGSSLFYVKPDRSTIGVVDVHASLTSGLTERFNLVGHGDAVMWVGQSPDGQVLATSSWDKTVRLWSPEDGSPVKILQGSTGQSWTACFSRDSQFIAAGSGDKHVRIWKIATGELVHTLGGHTGWIRSLQFNAEGKYLVAGGEGGAVKVYDVATGETVQSWQLKADSRTGTFLEMNQVDWKGERIFIKAPDGRIVVYDVQQHCKWELAPDVQYSRGFRYGNMVAAESGRRVYSADFDQSVRAWELD